MEHPTGLWVLVEELAQGVMCWRGAVALLPLRDRCCTAFSASAIPAGLQDWTVVWPLEMDSFM